jgi:hypothetical protein
MIAALFLGIVVGAASMILIGLYLVARQPKPEAKPATPSAIGLDLSGKSTEIDAYHAKLLNEILQKAGEKRFFELPGQHTRH